MYERPVLTRAMHGNQDFLNLALPNADLFDPRLCLSYKAQVRGKPTGINGARVVYFHGEPKQNSAIDPWIAANWS
jgi:hypothetical protein